MKFLARSPAAPIADDFIERAAVAEFDGGLPRPIAEGLAHLQTIRPLPGFSRTRWGELVDGACKFADRWAHRALALGWREIELFGALPAAPTSADCRGLALMLADRDVVMMDETVAILRPHAGGEQRYRRWTENRGARLIWDINVETSE